MKCPTCDRTIRKGTGRNVLIAPQHRGDKPRNATVCGKCAARGFLVVVPAAVTVPPLCSACGGNPAAVCVGCYARVGGNVQQLAAANAVLALRAAPLLPDPAEHAT